MSASRTGCVRIGDAEVAVVEAVPAESLEQEVVVPAGVDVGVDDARSVQTLSAVARDVGRW